MGTEQRAPYIDFHSTPPLVGVDFPERSQRADDPGIIDQEINPTKLLLYHLHELGDRLSIGGVC
jgi:hypothetical protein